MKKLLVITTLIIALLLQGCSSTKDEKQTDNTVKGGVSITPEVTKAATATPKPVDLILPTTVNDTGKVLIQTVSNSPTYPFNSYIITSVNGESVVVDPTLMPLKSVIDINPAAIVSTHSHSDHNDIIYERAYDCPQILYKKMDIKTKDFKIYTVASAHNADKIDDSNFIAVFEVNGLRIAHMGDIGQSKLTKEQLKEIGKIDIAFMQFENSYSSMDLDNEKGFKLIEQLNPKIVIPTHYTEDGLNKLKEKYGEVKEMDNILAISKEDLPDKSLNVYRILNKHKYK
jgi:Predicted Zn-dependent hydrolases of the beta-lactamase fold